MTVENGSDAVTYGDHAVGGVVSIHLKPLKDRDNLLSMQVGSFADLLTTWQWKKHFRKSQNHLWRKFPL